MFASQLETSCQVKLMLVTSPNHFTTKWLWLSWPGLLSSSVSGLLSSPTTSFITLGKRDHFHPCLEVSTLSVDTQLVRSAALLASCARPLALLSQLELSLNQGQMALAAQQSTTSIWQSVFSVGSARRLAQSTQSWRVPTSSMQPSSTRSYFTTRRS